VVTAAFRITNLGEAPDSYRISIVLPRGFAVVVAPEVITVQVGEARTVLVSLFVSSDAIAGAHSASLRAESLNDPSAIVSVAFELAVLPQPGVELALDPALQGRPGQAVECRLWITNLGNLPDTFRISVQSSWGARVSSEVVPLPPGARAELGLLVSIPEMEVAGDGTQVRVLASSLIDPAVRTEEAVWIDVLPPLPEEVYGTLFPVVPAEVRWTTELAGQDLGASASWVVGGDIGGDTYLATGGSLNVDLSSLSFVGIWGECRRREWSLSVGQVSLATPLGDVAGIGFAFSGAPPNSPCSVEYVRTGENSALRLALEFAPFDLGLYCLGSGGTAGATASLVMDNARIDVQSLGGLSSLYIAAHAALFDISGGVAWDEGLGTSLSVSCGGLSGQLSSVTEETAQTRKLGLSFDHQTSDQYGVRWAAEAERKQGQLVDRLRVRGSAGLGWASDLFSWDIGVDYVTSSEFLVGRDVSTLSVRGAARLGSKAGWEASIEARVSGTAGTSLPLTTADVEITATAPLGEAQRVDARWSPVRREASLALQFGKTTLEAAWSVGRFTISVETRFDTPLPIIETRGRIEGDAFSDANLNGARDPDELGIAGLLISCGDQQAVTDESGLFRFAPMAPGLYEVMIANPGARYCYSSGTAWSVPLAAGKTEHTQIVAVPAGRVDGLASVYRGAMQLTPGAAPSTDQWVLDRPLPGARVHLSGLGGSYLAVTDVRGAFDFDGLCPGHWELRVEIPEMAPPHRTEFPVYEIDVAPGGVASIEVRVVPEPRILRSLGG